VPFIYDPATRTAVSDSQKIVAYLEAQYPTAPTLFPPHTRALQAAFTEGEQAPLPRFSSSAGGVYLLPLFTKMSPRSQAWTRARYEQNGLTVEQIGTFSDAQLAEKTDGVLKVLNEIDGWMRAGDESGVFLTGDVPSNADVFLASGLIMMKNALGEQHEMWKAISAVNGGRWAKYMETFASRNWLHVA
jgi:glutathione S-transferase